MSRRATFQLQVADLKGKYSGMFLFWLQFCLILGVYQVLRLCFLAWNWPTFELFSLQEVLSALVLGLRFDLSAIAFINSPLLLSFVLVFLLPQSRFVKKLSFLLFISLNMFFLVLAVADLEWYQFTGSRMSKDVLYLGQDIENQSFKMMATYWHFTLFYFIIFAGVWKLTPKIKNSKLGSKKVFWTSVAASALLLVLFARGGLQLKPLKSANAYQFSKASLGVLALNTPFHFIKSRKSEIPEAPQFDSEQLRAELHKAFDDHPLRGSFKAKNLVIIILESFATEYTGLVAESRKKSYTPFFDQLSFKSLRFINNFSNGRKSIEAAPSILCSLPSLMVEPFITSSFQSNEILGLGTIFKNRGYSTMFFHGAENGTMYFDSFTKRLGFEKYFGSHEYPNPDHFDGAWGVFDHHFFSYMIKKLDQEEKPFVSVFFSLSSHHPYLVPPEFSGQFDKGDLDIHESIGYTDKSLQLFFEEAKQHDWYQNTLFLVTADHTSKNSNPDFNGELGPYRVPLIFFDPSNTIEAQENLKLSQHADILPSVLDLFGFKNQTLGFGQSVFQPKLSPRVVNYSNQRFWMLKEKNYYQFGNQEFYAAKVKNYVHIGPLKKIDRNNSELGDFKILIQHFIQGLNNGGWAKNE